MDDIVAYALILLHMVNGVEVAINPAQITSLQVTTQAGRGTSNTLVHKDARCVVWLGSGRFYSVVEECSAIRQMIETTP